MTTNLSGQQKAILFRCWIVVPEQMMFRASARKVSFTGLHDYQD